MMQHWRPFFAVAAALCVLLAGAMAAAAQEPPASSPGPAPTVLEADVTAVLDERQLGSGPESQLYQLLQLEVTAGPRSGEVVVVENGQFSAVNVLRYDVGDRLLITGARDATGAEVFFITDSVRRRPLALLFLLFVVVTVLVGRARGAASLVGMALSFAVIFAFVLPQILAGRDPILVAIAAAAVIIPVTFYLSHGLNQKTSAAIVGTLVALVITGLLARLFVGAADLTGFSSEEAGFLQEAAGSAGLNMRGLLLASIIIGLLGILDDITVSQSAVVHQLRAASPGMALGEVYRRAMDVGTDHIASLVNTLVLVYTSSALPLLLLFSTGAAPFREAINYEIVAEEVVRTLVASIGLVLAVPVTTAVACLWLSREAEPD